MKKIISIIFLISIAITAGCLSKESVSDTPTTESLQTTPVPAKEAAVTVGAGIEAENSAAANTTNPNNKWDW